MLSLPLTIVCLAAVLPIHLTSCRNPLLWASVEAQAVYKTNANGVHGGDCSSVPYTFEMRVDGSSLLTSEFGLTGNFDEDCGIQIHLSIPEEDDQLKETVDLKTARDKINNDKKDLQVKEDALEEEKKAHEKKMEELKEEMNTVKETKDKLKELMTDETDLGKRKEDNVRRRNLLKEKKEKLGKDLDIAIKENEDTWMEILKKITEINADVVLLDKLSNAKCSRIPPLDYEIISDKIDVPKSSDIYICYSKELNILDAIEEMWKSEKEKLEKRKKDLVDEEGTWKSKEMELTNEIKEHNDQIKALKMEEKGLKTILQENKSAMDKQKNRKNDMDSKRKILEDRMIALGHYSKVEFIEREENRVSQEKSDMEKEIRRLERLISAECWMIHDIEYMIIFSEISEYQQNIVVCTPKE